MHPVRRINGGRAPLVIPFRGVQAIRDVQVELLYPTPVIIIPRRQCAIRKKLHAIIQVHPEQRAFPPLPQYFKHLVRQELRAEIKKDDIRRERAILLRKASHSLRYRLPRSRPSAAPFSARPKSSRRVSAIRASSGTRLFCSHWQLAMRRIWRILSDPANLGRRNRNRGGIQGFRQFRPVGRIQLPSPPQHPPIQHPPAQQHAGQIPSDTGNQVHCRGKRYGFCRESKASWTQDRFLHGRARLCRALDSIFKSKSGIVALNAATMERVGKL